MSQDEILTKAARNLARREGIPLRRRICTAKYLDQGYQISPYNNNVIFVAFNKPDEILPTLTRALQAAAEIDFNQGGLGYKGEIPNGFGGKL